MVLYRTFTLGIKAQEKRLGAYPRYPHFDIDLVNRLNERYHDFYGEWLYPNHIDATSLEFLVPDDELDCFPGLRVPGIGGGNRDDDVEARAGHVADAVARTPTVAPLELSARAFRAERRAAGDAAAAAAAGRGEAGTDAELDPRAVLDKLPSKRVRQQTIAEAMPKNKRGEYNPVSPRSSNATAVGDACCVTHLRLGRHMTAAEALGHLSHLPMALGNFNCDADIALYLSAAKRGATPHQIAAIFNARAVDGGADHLITAAYARTFEDKLTSAKSAGLFSQHAEQALKAFWRLVRSVANSQDWGQVAQEKPEYVAAAAAPASSAGGRATAADRALDGTVQGGDGEATPGAAPGTPPPPPRAPLRATPQRAAKTKGAKTSGKEDTCSSCHLLLRGAGHVSSFTARSAAPITAYGYCPVTGAWARRKKLDTSCTEANDGQGKKKRGEKRTGCLCTGCKSKKAAAHAALAAQPAFHQWVRENVKTAEVAAVAARYVEGAAPPIEEEL